MTQAATASNRTVDYRFGFPGLLPGAKGGPAIQGKILKFFDEYVKCLDARKAARASGYGPKWQKTRSYLMLKEHRDYVQWLQAHAAQQRVERLVIEQEPILQEMAQIAYLNEADFVLTETIDGKKVTRRKELHELTRPQLATIVVKGQGSNLHYELRDKEAALLSLGKYLGLFNEKIVLERRHVHMHMFADGLREASQGDLDILEAQFEEVITRKFLPAPAKTK